MPAPPGRGSVGALSASLRPGRGRAPASPRRRCVRSAASRPPAASAFRRPALGAGLGVVVLSLLHLACAAPSGAGGVGPLVRVGSKSFTESVVLGEIVAQLARDAGAQVEHQRQLGGTRVLWNALRSGEIDVYTEYTGTLREEILRDLDLAGEDGLRAAVAARGIGMSRPLGFNNTYALGMRRQQAARLGIETISDLRGHPGLAFGFGNEFMDRGDGWPSLRRRYELPQTEVRGLDHDLAYRGIAAGEIDVIDLYSTDAEIRFYDLVSLHDDLGHFTDYDAVLLYRDDLEERAPQVVASLERLEGRISESAMIDLNARAKLERVPESRVAADFLAARFGVQVELVEETVAGRLTRRLLEHLALVGISMLGGILVAVPLGIMAARRRRFGHVILAAVGVVQTVPSLALLAVFVPLLGLGATPAIAALFLYSLLPIVRNTHAGLVDIPRPLIESAEALGLTPGARLRLVELPLAASSIIAGIKTSAVINVGTATLGALIGAGGFGQPILTGIRLADLGLILQGAVPAALLAVAVQWSVDLSERWIVSRGLRL